MKKAKLLWIDLEMTGLDPEKDRIMEIAVIATDMKMNEIARYEAVAKVPQEIIQSRMVGEFWDKNQPTRDALISANPDGRDIAELDQELADFIGKHFGSTVYLAGNSIHQDRKFLEREMLRTNSKLHYRMLDVSAWKIYFETALNRKFTKPENHRAMSDIEGSIEEFKWYLTFLK